MTPVPSATPDPAAASPLGARTPAPTPADRPSGGFSAPPAGRPSGGSSEPAAALRTWVMERNPGLDPGALRDDTPLLDNGLLSSLQVMDLLLFVESLRGAPVAPAALRPGTFRDLASIRRLLPDHDPER